MQYFLNSSPGTKGCCKYYYALKLGGILQFILLKIESITFAGITTQSSMADQLPSFLQRVNAGCEKQELIKITLGSKRNKDADLKNVFIKVVTIKNTQQLSFLYRYPTKDITKNFDPKEAIVLIEKMLQAEFYNADLFTVTNDFHLLQNKKGAMKIITKLPSLSGKTGVQQHDKQKARIVKSSGNIYLHALGITTAEGLVKKDMQDKYKQINRYIEIIEGIVKDLKFSKGLHVVDMGSGKGYLTFALYDYLANTLQLQPTISGVELRQDLVSTCNKIAAAAHFSNLHFETGTIADATLAATDILIALHACDTATDDAIFKGIQANAKVIICAPCCHKQIRRQMKPDNVLSAITKHGILLERQAEIVTDSIRALLLEASGYKTKVFEFIATEHTPKNVLITGIKSELSNTKKLENLEKVKALKKLFNLENHYLETLLLPLQQL